MRIEVHSEKVRGSILSQSEQMSLEAEKQSREAEKKKREAEIASKEAAIEKAGEIQTAIDDEPREEETRIPFLAGPVE